MQRRIKTGIVGCGNISARYIATARAFSILDVVAAADLDPARAQKKAAEFGVPRACSVPEILNDPDIELIVNLTVPKAHAEVALAALAAGKHVYNEKPLGVTVEEGRKIVALAREKKLRAGCAPGTFLGAGLQTCRQLIDSGAIGQPVAATAFMACPGHESWHPDPEFYYEIGGGPMLDMGPYYLTALANLLGPIQTVAGVTAIAIPERVIGSEPKRGKRVKVETPDHVAGTARLANGVVLTMLTSFAVRGHTLPLIQIYGTGGTLNVPDPNSLRGPVLLRQSGDAEWREMPLRFGHDNGDTKWGIGVADLAYAIRSGRAHRASGENALHVLEAMHAFLDSSTREQYVKIAAPFTRPAPLPMGLAEDALDD